MERKISSPSHKLTYTRLQKKISNNSIGDMISPARLMDADFHAIEDNSYDNIFIHPYETPEKHSLD